MLQLQESTAAPRRTPRERSVNNRKHCERVNRYYTILRKEGEGTARAYGEANGLSLTLAAHDRGIENERKLAEDAKRRRCPDSRYARAQRVGAFPRAA